jgi:hypothetical protein
MSLKASQRIRFPLGKSEDNGKTRKYYFSLMNKSPDDSAHFFAYLANPDHYPKDMPSQAQKREAVPAQVSISSGVIGESPPIVSEGDFPQGTTSIKDPNWWKAFFPLTIF